MPVVEYEKLSQKAGEAKPSVKIKERVMSAREKQKARAEKLGLQNKSEKLNSQISAKGNCPVGAPFRLLHQTFKFFRQTT